MMNHRPDEDGRYALSMQEYKALRTIFGCVNALDDDHEILKARCKLIKDGWRDLRMLTAMSKRLMEKLLCTIPRKKLLTIQRELQHTICEVKIRPIAAPHRDNMVCVSEDAMIRVCNRAMRDNCFLCDKTHKEAKRTCELYRDVQACFPYDFDDSTDCPFAGMSGLRKEGDVS